jgi:aspartate aminotransferase
MMNLIELTSGEMHLPPMQVAVNAGVEAIQQGLSSYSPTEGIYELREAIASHYQQSQADIMPENVLITGGARHAIYNVLGRILDPGDEVILPAPYWHSYPDMIRQARGRLVLMHTNSADNFSLDPLKLEALITPRTKLFVLTNPCNPTGRVYTEQELGALVEVLERHPHVQVLSDEIFEFITFGSPFCSIGSWQSIADRVVVVSSFSKTFAMPGWRVGFIVGSEKLIQQFKQYQEVTHAGISIFTQKAAAAAWKHRSAFFSSLLPELEQRRQKGMEMLKSVPGLHCYEPQATFYLFPDISGFIGKRDGQGNRLGSAADIARYLYTDAGVRVLYGELFGDMRHLRISFGGNGEEYYKGIEKVNLSLSRLAL